MRALLVIAAAAVLAVPAAAPAKGWPGVLRICGESACRIVEGENDGDALRSLALMTGGGAAAPARPGPFYELAILPLDDRGRPLRDFPSMRTYYAPRSDRVRMSSAVAGEGVWRTPERIPPVVAAATRRLRPYPAPLLVRVEVDRRVARDPQSYLRLFRLAAARRPIADPAGPYPSNGDRGADSGEIVRYWQRVDRHWLPVSLSSRRPSPWGDEWTFVWVARRLPLVKRDGEIVRVPRALAERIRAARSLRP